MGSIEWVQRVAAVVRTGVRAAILVMDDDAFNRTEYIADVRRNEVRVDQSAGREAVRNLDTGAILVGHGEAHTALAAGCEWAHSDDSHVLYFHEAAFPL